MIASLQPRRSSACTPPATEDAASSGRVGSVPPRPGMSYVATSAHSSSSGRMRPHSSSEIEGTSSSRGLCDIDRESRSGLACFSVGWSNRTVTRGSLFVAALAVVAAAPGPAAAVEVTAPDLENRTLATGLNTPTAIAWTPDGRLLITDKWGVVKLVNRRNAPFGRVILDISGRVATREDTGLMGIEVDRDFARNGFIYLTYAFDPNPSAPGGPKTARLSRFKLGEGGRIVGGARGRGERVILGRVSRGPCPPPANDIDCMPTDYS